MIRHSAPTLGPDEERAVTRVLRSGRLAQGPEVAAFEEECAAFLGRRHGVAVCNGTSALRLAIGALGMPPSASVAIPSYTCMALATAVTEHGACPSLCDNDDTWNIREDAMPPGCDAAIVPHMFGAPAPLPALDAVVEDIAQSFGGPTGKATRISVVSFYATKLMTTGEGGMLFTDDDSVAEYIRDRRDYDNRDDFAPRHNLKMTEMQAAMGRVQLRRLRGFIDRRRAIAGRYSAAFAGFPLALPAAEDHVFFRYVVGTPLRDALERFLLEREIEAKRPVYRPGHHYLGGAFPGADRAHATCLSLPVHPSLIDEDVQRVIESVARFFEES